jgi:hypothetical protein
LWLTRQSRRKLLIRLEREWGAVGRPQDWDADRASEAWRDSGQPADVLALDGRTWSDLDLDAVLAAIDHTRTSLGRQRLYARLRSGAVWSASPGLEMLSRELQDNRALRTSIGVALATGGRSIGAGFWLITRPDAIRTRWWYWAFPFLAIATLASMIAIAVSPMFILVATGLVVVNLLVRMATAWQVPGILTPMRQIGPLIRVAEQLRSAFGGQHHESWPSDAEIAKLQPLKRIAAWVSRDANAAGDLVAGAWEYLNILFILDANALFFGGRHLRSLAPVLARVASWVGDVDVAYSVASLRSEPRGWCIPTVGAGSNAHVVGAWHPLIAHAVTNDAEFPAGRGLVVTGANMSGKSTYLRTIGIAAVLARGINTCPAASWQGRWFRVRSLIGRSDDLAAGKSYYQVEAEGVVELLRVSTESTPTLFLLDELLRGTNTVERLAAGEAVLRAMLSTDNERGGHVVVVATHDGELVGMLADLYTPFHFRETVAPDGLHFDFVRREGPAGTRTAIALLEATGAPSEVVAAARNRAEALDAARRAGKRQ